MRLRTLVSAAVLAAAMSSASGAHAAEPSPGALAAARELTEIVNGTGFQAAMIDPSWAPVEAAIRRAKPDVPTEKLAKLKEVFKAFLDEEMAPATADVPALYVKYFTEEELRAILTFYRTPAGAKALSAMPELMRDSMQIVSTRLTQSMPRFQERFQRALVENGLGDLK